MTGAEMWGRPAGGYAILRGRSILEVSAECAITAVELYGYGPLVEAVCPDRVGDGPPPVDGMPREVLIALTDAMLYADEAVEARRHRCIEAAAPRMERSLQRLRQAASMMRLEAME